MESGVEFRFFLVRVRHSTDWLRRAICEPRPGAVEAAADVHWKSKYETLLEPGTNGAATHLVQRVAVPPSIHVGFTETELSGSEDPAKETLVMHLYVPWASAVDANVRQREKIDHHILGSGHMIWPMAGAVPLSNESHQLRRLVRSLW